MTGAPPPRPTRSQVADELATHVRALAGPEATPRPEQIEAVAAVVADGRRTLLVARTGFGKSAVYFSATRMLRDRGWGPTLVVSPLLALMRDQVAAARRLGLVAETLNSSNVGDWDVIEEAVRADAVDLLLVSPERLANAGFRDRVLGLLLARPTALVCDEAHCISDWGHDFRPDYRRLRHLMAELPAWTPVLATTATANGRVTADVAEQLGADTLVLRTGLDRESLRLSVVELPDDAHRLAWLDGFLGRTRGSGIVYCLTQAQAEATSAWLTGRGHDCPAYTGATDPESRLVLEDRLRADEVRALVATSALGMGYDKGDLAFCIHLGLPPSPVAYYQQIGRAGRAVPRADVVALPRPAEDAGVWRWFDAVSLPAEEVCRSVLDQLSPGRATSVPQLEVLVNLGRQRLQTLLKILEVEGAVSPVSGGYVRTDRAWVYDDARADGLRRLRRDEAEQMLAYAAHPGCRLRFLREALDDVDVDDCGRCDRCRRAPEPLDVDPAAVADARRHLQGGDIEIEPRRQWPSGLDEPRGRIAADRQARWGRALCRPGDGGWDPAVALVLDGDDEVDEDLVRAVAGLLGRWGWDRRPTWICPVPSRRRPRTVDRLAKGLGQLGQLPVHRALSRDPGGPAQADQANSAHRVANVWGLLCVDDDGLPEAATLGGPVLLVDDECDSRWTVTVASHLLTGAGSGPVLPVVLRAH